ncbi:hypothetical protein [Robertkochia sediminum]|uniref:hypothetical protein n=1 Tax=Robertkochia sediminum TaxID=2785326 RepID=UPI001931B998|nr:hypothetical protein [Robertkochia sediminum]MBL7473564.1 hypothetical protein [Robertkochia sediminum]
MDFVKNASFRFTKNLTLSIDHIFVLFILLSGFLVYVHHLFPEIDVWATPFFEIAPKTSYDLPAFFYVFGVKVTPVLLLSIWFITSNHWWRWGLIFLLGQLLFQLYSFLYEDLGWFSGTGVLETLPYMMIYFILLIGCRSLLKYHLRNFAVLHHIGADNLNVLRGHKIHNKRIERVRDLMLADRLDRERLNLVYREYEYLKQLNADLEESHMLQSDAFTIIKNNLGLKRIAEGALFLLLASMPWFLKFYELAETGVGQYSFFYLTIWDFGFSDVRTMLWVLSTKLVVVLPVTIWFFTSRYWWKYFLLVPFSIFSVQIFEMFKPDQPFDGEEFFMVFPIIVVVLILMTLISLRIRRYLNLKEFYGVMEVKIKDTVRSMARTNTSSSQQQLQIELRKLMEGHKQLAPEEYLKALKDIKQRLEQLQQEV